MLPTDAAASHLQVGKQLAEFVNAGLLRHDEIHALVGPLCFALPELSGVQPVRLCCRQASAHLLARTQPARSWPGKP